MFECISQKTDIALYANDTKIWREIKISEDHFIPQSDIDKLCAWSNRNKLKCHPSKSIVLSITNRRNILHNLPFTIFQYRLNSTYIDYVSSYVLIKVLFILFIFSSIAEKMNAKVASSTLSHVNSSDENNFRKFLSSPKIPKIRDSIFLSHCDETELINIMKEFDNNKASDININVLKSISKLIVGHLVKFFNKFLDIGIFPTILKSGMITPIFKKGDSRYFDNYRPVSTLPVFGKILEKLMYNRLYSFLSSKNIIFRNQFGFRKKHSTSHAVNYSVDKVITEIEKKNML